MQQVFVSDVSNHGWLGYIDYNEDGTIVLYRNNPWDYVSLDSGSCALTNGSFNLSLVERADEIIYLDRAFFSWLASLYLY